MTTPDSQLPESTDSLAEALPREMARVRDEVIPAYVAVGPGGRLALAMMRAELDNAAKVMAAGDLPGMIRALQSLKEFEV